MAKGKYVPFNQLPKPVPGDLIQFNRGSFCHWAMYSDKPGYVFNICAENKDVTEALIALRSLEEVAGTSGIRINNLEEGAKTFNRLTPRTGAEAVAAARKDLGKKVPYNFIGTNCEYYSTKWKYGEGFSAQVKGNRSKGVYIGCLTAGTAIGATVGSIVPVAGTLTGALVGNLVGNVVGIGWVVSDLFTSGP